MDSWRLASAAVLALLALALWLTFLRPVQEQSRLGTVLHKAPVAGRKYAQYPVEANRGFRQPHEIALAESFAFELRLDDVPGLVRASFNTIKSQQFEVGQRVRVRYVERSLGPFGRRVTVLDMFPAEGR